MAAIAVLPPLELVGAVTATFVAAWLATVATTPVPAKVELLLFVTVKLFALWSEIPLPLATALIPYEFRAVLSAAIAWAAVSPVVLVRPTLTLAPAAVVNVSVSVPALMAGAAAVDKL